MRSLLLLTVLALPAACSNLHAVEEGRLYRSAQPSADDLRSWIPRYGIRTVLRLRGRGPGDPSYEASSEPARAGGADFLQIPLTTRRYPFRHELLALWEVFETARYPVLLHCRAGADRSGLASALYVLHRTGDVDRAIEQLQFVPYLHTGLQGTWRLREVLEAYRPYEQRMPFPDWVRTVYAPG